MTDSLLDMTHCCMCVSTRICMCLVKLTQPMSSKNNWADPKYLFVLEQHLTLQDNACTEATQLCVHSQCGPLLKGHHIPNTAYSGQNTLQQEDSSSTLGNVNVLTVFELTSFVILSSFHTLQEKVTLSMFSEWEHLSCSLLKEAYEHFVVMCLCQHWLPCCIMQKCKAVSLWLWVLSQE